MLFRSEAVLEIALPASVREHQTLEVSLRARAFLPQRLYSRLFTFMAGEETIGSSLFRRHDNVPKTLTFTLDAPAADTLRLRVIAHEEASPAEDGSADTRKLGLGVIDVTVR